MEGIENAIKRLNLRRAKLGITPLPEGARAANLVRRDRLKEALAALVQAAGQDRTETVAVINEELRRIERDLAGERSQAINAQRRKVGVKCQDCGWEARWKLVGEKGARLRNRPCEACGGRMRRIAYIKAAGTLRD